MKVFIQRKGDQTATEVSLADLLLNIATVSDRNDEMTIKINGEIYLLDTIEDIQKGEAKMQNFAAVSSPTESLETGKV